MTEFPIVAENDQGSSPPGPVLAAGSAAPRGASVADQPSKSKPVTPWRGRSIISSVRQTFGENAKANRTALSRMSLLERETGMGEEQHLAFHAEQRARVRARYGIEETA